jgi:hypothetical protein
MKKRKDEKRSPLKNALRRLPGQSLDAEINKIFLLLTIFTFSALIFLSFWWWDWWHWHNKVLTNPALTFVIAIAAIAFAAIEWVIGVRKLKRLILGRNGEREVGQALEELRQNGFAIFHDVIGRNFNIDHVIVSHHGIFVVETKTYRKFKDAKVTYDGKSITIGQRKPDDKPIRQVIAISDWLRNTLAESTGKTFTITPIVVFPGWWVDTTGRNNLVSVLNPKQLSYWISQLPLTIPDTDVHLVAFHLSRLYAAHPSTFNSFS